MWNLSEPELLRMEPSLRNLSEPGARFPKPPAFQADGEKWYLVEVEGQKGKTDQKL